jgi:hypothetical protein
MTNVSGSTVNVVNSTIAGNDYSSGGNIGGVNNYGTIAFKNTIIAANNGGNCANSATLLSNGHNLDSGSSCGFTQTGDLQNTDPQLGSLAYNGGLTRTRALLNSPLIASPAINAADDAGCPAADQRGILRPQGSHCDIGAFEYSACQNNPTHVYGTAYYDSFIGQAYNHSDDGQIIELQAYEFSEALNFIGGKRLTLTGGFDCDFSVNQGAFSSIRGSLTIRNDVLHIGNIIIK